MANRNWRKRNKTKKRIAEERIKILMNQAEKEAISGATGLADKYAALSRRISMRYKTPIPIPLKRQICKICGSYLYPGINCTVRLKRGHKIYHCEKCKDIKRIPYIKDKKREKK